MNNPSRIPHHVRPQSFEQTDQETLHDFIQQNSFATLISVANGEPSASHLPLLLDRSAGSQGRLIGHMARANPQWREAEGQEVLTIFQGPHAYISPTWYEAKNVVPTWNYVAVHVYGKLHLETDRDRLLEIVRKTVEVYETAMPQPWSLNQEEPVFVDGLLDGIVGFYIEINRIEGKWKLNQNHGEARRRKVVKALYDGGGEDRQRIADLMSLDLED